MPDADKNNINETFSVKVTGRAWPLTVGHRRLFLGSDHITILPIVTD